MPEAFPISGNIDPRAFPFLLMDLHRQAATGSLKVDGPSYQKAVYFRSGRILFGSSNDPRDQLGAILIEVGKITPEQLEDINAKVGPGNPLAKVLSESGVVSQRELGEAARAKVEQILSDVIAYETGGFEFEDGVLPKGAVDLKLPTERLLLAAVRRVRDRNFVLRHLESLEVVLTPTDDLQQHLPEFKADAGGLPEELDGRRTLKEAAGRTRLDEFEAAKVACALLFLGLLKRGPTLASADEIPLFTPPKEASELDLGQTARMAFADDDEPLPPTVMLSAPSQVPAEPEREPSFFAPGPAAAPAVSSPPPFEPEPQPEIAWAPPPAPPVRTSPPRSIALEPEPEMPMIPPPSKRPSKEDLAALDVLLKSRPPEGPLTPMERSVDRPPERTSEREQRWEPQFGQPARRGGARGGSSPRLVALVAAGVLVVGGLGAGGWLYVSSRPAPRHPAAAPATVATPSGPEPSASAPAGSRTAGPAASVAASTPAATAPSAAPSPAATPAPPTTRPPATTTAAKPAAPTPAGGLSLSDARALLLKGRLAEAAQGFAANLKAPKSAFSIQLLVACADETVEKAVQNVQAQELYILPVSFKGRNCYRLCWGIYESEDRANSASRSVPEYFRKGGATPKVLPASSLLP